MNNQKIVKSRGEKQLLLMILAFAVPVILAKVLLTSGFRGEVTTHGGVLVNNPVSYQELALDNPATGQWQMLYIAKNNSNELCLERLGYVQQTWRALGRLQERVTVVIATNNLRLLPAGDTGQHGPGKILSLESLSTLNYDQQVVIGDPLGNLMMTFEFPNDHQQSLVIAHNILLDLKQLLKLSRIG